MIYSKPREAEFKFVLSHLSKDAIVADIGSLDGYFCSLHSGTCYNLDRNPAHELENFVKYEAPNPIPFKDNELDAVHASHLIEHLDWNSLKELLKEMARVVKPGGIIALSTPLMHDKFWGEPEHVRPYPISIFLRHLHREHVKLFDYEVVDYHFRYRNRQITDEMNPVLRKVINLILRMCGVKEKTGYTIILKLGGKM